MIFAILSQNRSKVGLFEQIKVFHQNQYVYWFRPVNFKLFYPLELIEQVLVLQIGDEYINCFSSCNIFFDGNNNIQNEIVNAVLQRIPYCINLIDRSIIVPVFSISPDSFLAWNTTTYSEPIIHRSFSAITRTLRYPHISTTECAITMATILPEDTFWLPCGHGFSDAIFEAANWDRRCPLCRSVYELDDIEI